MMKFIRLLSPDDNRLTEAMKLYEISFPNHEQREADSQRRILCHSEYHFDLIYDEDLFVGIILYWETEKFLYVEHFCIHPEMRNHRYGQRALELLNGKGKTVILEIDPPVDEISIHRKVFYERAGYQENPFEHVHPPYHEGNAGHPLMILSCPDPITSSDYEQFKWYLEHVVMEIPG